HPRLHRLLDQPDLLGGWPAATALNRGNHFNAGRRTILIGGHSRNHRRMPMPYRATLPVRSKRGAVHHVESPKAAYKRVIDEICNLNWAELNEEDLIRVAWAYYHFSIQFRECLEIARHMYPDDDRLLQLDHGERETDNLSPWPGVAKDGEKMNHDEFMRRTLELAKIPEIGRIVLADIGNKYLKAVRAID